MFFLQNTVLALRVKKILKFLIFTGLLLLMNNKLVANLAILPVANFGLEQNLAGPRLSSSTEENSWELAKAVFHYLKIGQIRNLISPQRMEKVFDTLQISWGRKIILSDLKKIATALDADEILVMNITKQQQGYQIDSKLYYNSNAMLTDSRTHKGEFLWKLIGQHLEERFKQLRIPKFATSQIQQPLIVLADASGKNYQEIKELGRQLKLHNSDFSAACLLDGNGQLSFSKKNSQLAQTGTWLQNFSARGGNQFLKNFLSVFDCFDRQVSTLQKDGTKPLTIILVGSAPAQNDEKIRVSAKVRSVAEKSKILILGSGSIKTEAREYWRNIAESLRSKGGVSYEDLTYQIKVGLSDGEEYNIYKRGFQIFENQNDEISASEAINVPSHKKDTFTPGNLQTIYEELSKNKVLTNNPVKILMALPMQKVLKSSNLTNNLTSYMRILIEVEKKAFWISLPHQAMNDEYGERISVEKSYYFMVHLNQQSRDEVIYNSPNFGFVFSERKTLPQGFQLSVANFLKKPEAYLRKSIGGSSVYYLFGKVKMIRNQNQDVLER